MSRRLIAPTIASLALLLGCTDDGSTSTPTDAPTTTEPPRTGVIPDEICNEIEFETEGALVILTPDSVSLVSEVYRSLVENAPTEVLDDLEVFASSLDDLAAFLGTLDPELGDSALLDAVDAELEAGRLTSSDEAIDAAAAIDEWVLPDCRHTDDVSASSKVAGALFQLRLLSTVDP
jgi:hypothetical protein